MVICNGGTVHVHMVISTLFLGKVIEVEEGEILSFHFTNFTPQRQFVYILCLEETGEWARGGASACIDHTISQEVLSWC